MAGGQEDTAPPHPQLGGPLVQTAREDAGAAEAGVEAIVAGAVAPAVTAAARQGAEGSGLTLQDPPSAGTQAVATGSKARAVAASAEGVGGQEVARGTMELHGRSLVPA